MNDIAPQSEQALARSDHKFLLQFVDTLHEKLPLQQFLGGLSMGLRSIRFLFRHPELWASVAIPAAINFVLFVITAVALVWNSGAIMGWFWAQPDSTALLFLWWFLRILFVPLMLLISYVSVIIFGGVVASPFNETLSSKTELILRGQLAATDGSLKGNAVGAARGIATAALTATGYAICMVPVILISLVPGVGSVIGAVLGATVSSFFLSLEYTDHALERRQYRWRDKVGMIWSHKPLAAGFGLGTSMLLWVPVVNFLTMPIAVIGGTAVSLSLDAKGMAELDQES